MRSALALLLVAVAACDTATAPRPDLTIAGDVVARRDDAPVAVANVAVWSDGIASTPRELLGWTTTDEQGLFELTVGKPPGFARANCNVMNVVVAAEGFSPVELPMRFALNLGAEEPSPCTNGGSVEATIRLDAAPPTLR